MDPLDPRLHIIPNVPRRHLPHEAFLNRTKDEGHQLEDHSHYRHREHPTTSLHPRPDQGTLPTSLSWIQDRWHSGIRSEKKKLWRFCCSWCMTWANWLPCPESWKTWLMPKSFPKLMRWVRVLFTKVIFIAKKFFNQSNLNYKEILQLHFLVLEDEWSHIRTWGCFSWTFFHQQPTKPISECQFLSEPSPIIALP